MQWNPLLPLLNILYPNLCVVCGESLLKHEELLCLSCLHSIPKTNFHLQPENNIEKRFWGKVSVERATAFFYFQKGSPFQKILHNLKYNDNKELGRLMGKYAGVDLSESLDFNAVDLIIPVPLHPAKMKQRGYNQSEWIGMGVAELLGKPQNLTSLVRTKANVTQTKKSIFDRFENTEGIFEVADAQAIAYKHILLVDDVLTTGSTLEACIHALLGVEGVRVSVFALAVA